MAELLDRFVWGAGTRVSVRGQMWTIVERTAFLGCQALRLRGAEPENRTTTRTLLVPFDRPVAVQSSRSVRVVRPRRWLHELRARAAATNPLGGLSSIAPTAITLLPYQLEPALAMLRFGHARVLIADDVGLGKTIQAGVILRQLAAERESFRAVVITPAGLREQWTSELGRHLGLEPCIATSAWLSRCSADLPADVNPWGLPGIYLCSFDFIKRPEALRPLEEVDWDVVVVDEAHAATNGTARYAAVHMVALRSRRVVLLSATPHSGDAEQFRGLCRIGLPDRAGPRLLLFRRSRTDADRSRECRTVLLAVRLSDAERRMHRSLETYTSRLCAEVRGHRDTRARLAAIVLAKRALSSAASLGRSCRRRVELLAGMAANAPAGAQQLSLPLAEDDLLEDEEPDSLLAAPGLTDGTEERRWLTAISDAADEAALNESKIRLLQRLLRRVGEPAIVFTEYRDTLDRLRHALAGNGRHATLLHGGMTPQERDAAQREFNSSGTLLLATDAASEGLNLHHRCRIVVHFELPWNPARLAQRTGRVDRIGQQRIVHEVILVADDTSEKLVLAPLMRRSARARSALHGASRVFNVLSESRVAAAVLEGAAVDPDTLDSAADCEFPTAELHVGARDEATRLSHLRVWAARGSDVCEERIAATTIPTTGPALPPGVVLIHAYSAASSDGRIRHSELLATHHQLPASGIRLTPSELRRSIDTFRRTQAAAVELWIRERMGARWADVVRAVEALDQASDDRGRIVAASRRSTAQRLVQAGLFDRRALRIEPAQEDDQASDELSRLQSRGAVEPGLTTRLTLSAILFVSGRRSP
jgi:superfamily II DNA or RNA helicase